MTNYCGHIVITGFMGCGKTEVARALCAMLARPFVDLDDAITQREGKSPAKLIIEGGEESFRHIETLVLQEVLNAQVQSVISLGGGAWIQAGNRELINQSQSITVWLDTPFEVCWQRILASGEDRPLGRTLSQARELFDKRLPIYGLTQICINVGPLDSPIIIARRVETALSSI